MPGRDSEKAAFAAERRDFAGSNEAEYNGFPALCLCFHE